MNWFKHTQFKFIILFNSIILCNYSLAAQEVTIEIDTTIQHQKIDNFGASDCWSFQKIGTWPASKKELIADLLFSQDKGIGLSAWRFNIGGGVENNRIDHPWRSVETFEVSEGVYDWSRQSEEVWFLHAAKERGVKQFIAFVNSPPARMTKSGYTNCNDGLGSTNLKDDFEGQYATYLADILEHFKNDGFEFDYVSPVNEPIWEWNRSNQEGNRASNADIKTMVNAIYDTLQTRALDVEILIPEAGELPAWTSRVNSISNKYGELYGNFLADFCNDTTMNYKISKNLCGHSYWSDQVASELFTNRYNFNLNFSQYKAKGWKYWMSEYCQLEGPNGEGGSGRDLSINTALNIARIIYFDLTVSNASAWQWWTAVSPEDYKDGLIYTDYFEEGDFPSIYKSKTLWAMGHYSRYIRPGSQRISCSGASDRYSVMASAYLDRSNERIVIVVINMSNTSKDLAFDFANFKDAGHLKPYLTNSISGNDLKELDAVAANDRFTIPARSMVTFLVDLKQMTAVEEQTDASLPENLITNYPNPFNSNTSISFTLKSNGRVIIELYDLLGRKIDTILDDVQLAGKHMFHYSMQDLASGIYFIKITCSRTNQLKKIIYLK